MQSDEEEAVLKSDRDFTVLHIVCFHAVHMELLPQLSSVFGIGADGLKSDRVGPAAMVRKECSAGADRTSG